MSISTLKELLQLDLGSLQKARRHLEVCLQEYDRVAPEDDVKDLVEAIKLARQAEDHLIHWLYVRHLHGRGGKKEAV